MSETDFHIDYVANLARIELSPEEKAHFGQQLDQILGYVDQLKSLDVEGVEPTAHPFSRVNVLRADEVKPGLSHEDALSNAPRPVNGLFGVPKIVE